jgi:hypothetical protein
MAVMVSNLYVYSYIVGTISLTVEKGAFVSAIRAICEQRGLQQRALRQATRRSS